MCDFNKRLQSLTPQERVVYEYKIKQYWQCNTSKLHSGDFPFLLWLTKEFTSVTDAAILALANLRPLSSQEVRLHSVELRKNVSAHLGHAVDDAKAEQLLGKLRMLVQGKLLRSDS